MDEGTKRVINPGQTNVTWKSPFIGLDNQQAAELESCTGAMQAGAPPAATIQTNQPASVPIITPEQPVPGSPAGQVTDETEINFAQN